MLEAQKTTLTHLRAAHAAASTLPNSREKALTLTAIEEAGLSVIHDPDGLSGRGVYLGLSGI